MKATVIDIVDVTAIDDQTVRQLASVDYHPDGWRRHIRREGKFAEVNPGDVIDIEITDVIGHEKEGFA